MSDAFHATGLHLEDLSDAKPKRVKVNGLQVLLVRLPDGVRAFTPVCPHANGDLTYGSVFDGAIECPLHGWRFSIDTGACLDPVGGGTLRTFPVDIRDGIVCVEIARPKWMDD
jgi:nitrite reductase/ring-hydroxylating ferredoxin subunit